MQRPTLPKLTLKKIDFHRNGISGDPFYVVLFDEETETDIEEDGEPLIEHSTKVAIRFDYADVSERKMNRIAVLDSDMVGQGIIEFGANSWRGDHYVEQVDRWISELEARLFGHLIKNNKEA